MMKRQPSVFASSTFFCCWCESPSATSLTSPHRHRPSTPTPIHRRPVLGDAPYLDDSDTTHPAGTHTALTSPSRHTNKRVPSASLCLRCTAVCPAATTADTTTRTTHTSLDPACVQTRADTDVAPNESCTVDAWGHTSALSPTRLFVSVRSRSCLGAQHHHPSLSLLPSHTPQLAAATHAGGAARALT
jgi:hypothetical protein